MIYKNERYDIDIRVYHMKDILLIKNRKLNIVHKYLRAKTYNLKKYFFLVSVMNTIYRNEFKKIYVSNKDDILVLCQVTSHYMQNF